MKKLIVFDYICVIIELLIGIFAIGIFLHNFIVIIGSGTTQQLIELAISLIVILVIFRGFKRENILQNKLYNYENTNL